MTRRSFVWRDGKMVERGRPSEEVDAPFVHQDSFKSALKHPKTGEMVESLSRWNQINKEHGLRVVGNDWVDAPMKHDVKDRITDEKIIEATEKALSIELDPDKRKVKRGQEREDLERFMKHRGYSYEAIATARQIQEMIRGR